MKTFRIVVLLLLAVGVFGCSTEMVAPGAQVIKLEFKEGTGKIGGILKASSPGTAGISAKNFDFEAPGSFEVKGGPSDYMLTFNSLPKGQEKGWVLSLDGRELKRGADMIVEDDKGPRVLFSIDPKASATPSE
jgi:hypothetical protein